MPRGMRRALLSRSKGPTPGSSTTIGKGPFPPGSSKVPTSGAGGRWTITSSSRAPAFAVVTGCAHAALQAVE
jgi:hypothetical protein